MERSWVVGGLGGRWVTLTIGARYLILLEGDLFFTAGKKARQNKKRRKPKLSLMEAICGLHIYVWCWLVGCRRRIMT